MSPARSTRAARATSTEAPRAEPVARTRGRRPAHGAPVVDRALELLDVFDPDHRAMTLGELCRRSGMPKTSVLRLAGRLATWGALEKRSDGRYVIGLRLWQVGSLAPRGPGLQQVAMPFMGDLAQVTRQHVLLAVRDDDEAVLVERLSAPQATRVLYAIGDRLPLHSTGVGLVLLAFADASFQANYLTRPLTHEPEGAPLPADELRRTLADARREGMAILHRSAYSVVSVAAPVFGSDDRIAAALSVVLPEKGLQPQLLGAAVRTTARSVSRSLGARRAIGLLVGEPGP